MPEDFPIMADLEKPAADTQQEENAVAMTEVGGNDPPVGPAIVGSLEDEGGEVEEGNLDRAVTVEEVKDEAVPEDAKQIEEVPFESEEPVVAQDDLVEQAAVMDGDLPGDVTDDTKTVDPAETDTKPETTEQQTVDQEPDAVTSVEDKKEDVTADDIQEVKEDEKMDVTPDGQPKPTDEDSKPEENTTQDAEAEDAAGSGLDDLFGTDDEGEQKTSLCHLYAGNMFSCSYFTFASQENNQQQTRTLKSNPSLRPVRRHPPKKVVKVHVEKTKMRKATHRCARNSDANQREPRIPRTRIIRGMLMASVMIGKLSGMRRSSRGWKSRMRMMKPLVSLLA
jgi:hypothetical protein